MRKITACANTWSTKPVCFIFNSSFSTSADQSAVTVTFPCYRPPPSFIPINTEISFHFKILSFYFLLEKQICYRIRGKKNAMQKKLREGVKHKLKRYSFFIIFFFFLHRTYLCCFQNSIFFCIYLHKVRIMDLLEIFLIALVFMYITDIWSNFYELIRVFEYGMEFFYATFIPTSVHIQQFQLRSIKSKSRTVTAYFT